MLLPTIVLGLTLLFLLKEVLDRRRKARLLPPGPQSLAQAITKVGPKAPHWIVFDALRETYGPILSFYRGATPVVVISKAHIAWDLLQKRGEIYSSRPRLVVANEILSRGMRGLSMPYSKPWRIWRKIQNTGMSGRASLAYCEHQTLESSLAMRGLLHSPDAYEHHIGLFATSVVLSISYGRRTTTLEDEIFKKNQECIMDFQRANVPGNPAETYPSLLYLPRFLQWFRYDWDAAYEKAAKLYLDLYTDVKERVKAGTAKECMATRCFKDQQSLGFTDLEIAFALSAPFGAGIDTTSATIEVALCAMLHNPAAMRKAQEELDRVVGKDRLPTFEDEPSLPYVGAFVKEINRWRPIVPLAVPHAVTTDDVYNGYFIPKGSTIFGNLYAIMKDPEMFPEPETFRPERFLDTDDPRMVDFTLSFGFGRRHCPGMHVALQSIYIVVSRILWAFDIEPVKDVAGKPILPNMERMIALGITRKPAPFYFTARPRFPEIADVIEKEAADAEKQLKAWD